MAVRFVFAAAGVIGALIGSTLGKMMDGQKLLALFALLMIVIGVLSLRKRFGQGDIAVVLSRKNALPLTGVGFLAGLVAGFFGIGADFLLRPALSQRQACR